MVGRKKHEIHRVVGRLKFGKLRKRDHVCHYCDNRVCYHHAHLFKGDAKSNRLDCVGKGRQAKGERISTAKLTPTAVRSIRRSGSRRIRGSVMRLAERFNVHHRTW